MIQKPFNISVRGQTIPAEEDNTITWQISGAVQTHYSLEIYNNQTDELLFSVPKTSGFQYRYTLLANSIANGLECKLLLTVYDQYNNQATSDPVIFQTSARPVVILTPIGVVASQSYMFSATYLQADDIPMQYWSAYLYNVAHILVGQSGLRTDEPIEYLATGLVNGETYYIEFQVTSEKGLIGTTGLVSFSVQYEQPQISFDLYPENIPNAGIKLRWYALQILGYAENHSFIDNEKINVLGNGKVWFDSNFNIEKNFTLKVILEGYPDYDIGDITKVIRSATPPKDINALWFKDPEQVTPTEVPLIISTEPPSDMSAIWWRDDNELEERNMGVVINLTQPDNIQVAWVKSGTAHETEKYLLRMVGEQGEILLEYYNSTFYLYVLNDEGKTLIDQYPFTGNRACVHIQQINDTLQIDSVAEVI